MRRSFPLNGVLVSAALMAALLLTVFRQAPEGLLTLGLGERVARAAPGEPAQDQYNRKKHNLTALKVFNLALVRVRDAYVDTKRIDPRKMMYAALDSVQLNVPEVLIEPYPEREEVTVVVNDKRQTFSTKEVDSPWRLSGKLKDVFRFIQTNMNPGADLAEVEYSAVNGMLSTLDPHSVLLDPESAKEMDISTQGHFGGLGIVIGMRKGKLTVIRPMPATPAFRAGVKKDDHIVRINNESTDHLTLTEAVNRMRGKEGTKVSIAIERKNHTGEIKLELIRDRIRVESVDSKYLDSHNVGYIKIKNFQGSTAREVKAAMKELRRKGATAWVLDLRYNPGGLLEQAIQVSDLFVDRGTIVTTVGGKERDARRASKKGTDAKAPIAVLVNGQSASASEIVAGALKNLDRAVVIGSSTFGKGSVQILYDNKDGSKLKLTIAEYLTPGDISIQSVGVPPDIELVRMFVPDELADPGDRLRLLRTKHTFREADLDAHLESKHAQAAGRQVETVKFLYERSPNADGAAVEPEPDDESAPELDPELADATDPDEIVEDFEMRFARDLVAQARSSRRSRILKEAKRFLAKRRGEEHEKMAKALGKLRVDWSAPAERTTPGAALSAVVRVEDKDGKPITDGVVKAGEDIKIVGVVTNNGSGPAYRVHARINTDDRVVDEAELAFGKVAPGAQATAHAWIRVPRSSLDRVTPMELEFREYNDAEVTATPLKLRIVARERPVFSYTHQLLDDGNGDGLVQRGEPLRLLATFKNTGAGTASEVTAVLSNKSGGNIDGVVINKGRFRFENGLEPGQSETVEFTFSTSGAFDRDELVLEMAVYDAVLNEIVTEKIKWPVQQPAAGPQALEGSVRVVRDGTAVREGASIDAAIVGYTKRNTVLDQTGVDGTWVRVDLGDGRPGFIAANAVSASRKRARSGAFDPLWQVTPPMLALDLPSLEAAGKTYLLRGTATDDTHIEDVYIFVSNREAKIDNKKVFYQSNRKGSQPNKMAFSHEVPLWPGSNFVTVVVRENDEVKASQSMFLYRMPDNAGASTAAR